MTRFYNPFALISSRRSKLALAQLEARANFDRASAWRDTAADAYKALNKAQRRLDAHAQAVEAFMDERGTLIADRLATADFAVTVSLENAKLRTELGENLQAFAEGADHVQRLGAFAQAMQQEAMRLNSEVSEQAGEIMEIVSWVKKAEAALAAKGLKVIDGPNGPEVHEIDAPQLLLSPPSAFALPTFETPDFG